MANESDGPPIWFWLGILVAALLGGVGIIIAAVKIARGIWWLPRIAGVVLWLLIVAFVPGAIMIDRKWRFRELGARLWLLPTATKLFFGVAALVMTLLPFLVARFNESEELVEVEHAA